MIKRLKIFIYTIYKNIIYKIEYFRYKHCNHKKLIEKKYKKHFKKKLNLIEPKTFNEKIQWLKLYWRDDKAIICADKYKVREFIKERGCEKILNKLYGCWEDSKQINFDNLPNSFVLKANNGVSQNIFIKDKSKINEKKIINKLNKMLKYKLYIKTFEWVYKYIKPNIICEKLFDISQGFPNDYKFFCFNGKPKFVLVASDRYKNEKITFLDINFNILPVKRKAYDIDNNLIKPDNFNEMLNYANILSREFPFVRVDLYSIENKIYFGELTFFPAAGYRPFEPQIYDEIFGDYLKLPDAKEEL